MASPTAEKPPEPWSMPTRVMLCGEHSEGNFFYPCTACRKIRPHRGSNPAGRQGALLERCQPVRPQARSHHPTSYTNSFAARGMKFCYVWQLLYKTLIYYLGHLNKIKSNKFQLKCCRSCFETFFHMKFVSILVFMQKLRICPNTNDDSIYL